MSTLDFVAHFPTLFFIGYSVGILGIGLAIGLVIAAFYRKHYLLTHIEDFSKGELSKRGRRIKDLESELNREKTLRRQAEESILGAQSVLAIGIPREER